MELTYATPALLFPTVSLLFLSYTNRFISYANLVRGLHEKWREDRNSVLRGQIENLRKRIRLIRNMQIAGALSLVCCVVCMVFIYFRMMVAADAFFAAALLAMIVSLILLTVEVSISIRALDLQLHDMEEPDPSGGSRLR